MQYNIITYYPFLLDFNHVVFIIINHNHFSVGDAKLLIIKN